MIWPKKPKTPGFGISRNFYLTVLAARATLPPPRLVVNPKGEGDAVPGFIVPLAKDATKDDLDRPMGRGAYGISSVDRKTVLRMLAMSKEEVGFDPAPFLQSSLAVGLDQELLARISATWTLLQVTFESHDPMVYEGVRFALRVCQRLAFLSEGVVSDPICNSYKLPQEVFANPQADPRIDARDVTKIWLRPGIQPDKLTAHSLGMQKFSIAEVELPEFDRSHAELAQRFLTSLCQGALLGELYEIGDKVGGDACLMQVVPGGLDRARWEGIPCFELIPPTGRSVDDGLLAWAAEQGA